MKKRLTQPKNNKYYIRQVSGGLNGAVAGKPVVKGANVLCNCVGYANGRFNEIINDPDLKGVVSSFKYQLVCNAENFIESAKRQGLKISSTPIEGGIMVWQKGGSLSGSDGAGHVAVVEAVYDDGTILTSESGYDAWAFKTVRRSNSNGIWGQGARYKFRGCIINPGVKDPKVVPVPPLVVDGVGGACTVRAMQRFFGTPQDGVVSGQRKDLSKHFPALTAVEFGKGGSPCIKQLQRWVGTTQDGVLGPTTIKAWQKKIGALADGVFGAGSMRIWQQYLNDHDKADYPTLSTPAAASSRWDKMTSWLKKIAADNSYHYVKWNSKDPKTKECPICKNHGKGKYHGWNCIGESFAAWRHGADIPCTCNCHVIDNAFAEKLLTGSYNSVLKQLKKKVGVKDITLIRNANGIPIKDLKPGDICLLYSGKKYEHTYPYIGNGYTIDCGNYKSTAKQIAKRKARVPKVVIRYTGK